ncbi:hypothetical protein OH146_13280 [Salinibacterium sp. SYSU T00001]|uniref:baeRF11 domain-containing protein n=1 Tax=Homoserinimonas sedimenticola TaxID=2986805 RepID=UPI002235F9E1|nr:hypothetical protein [Salinibacterium sedimenticola]MCW4386747.1 hypothetical protein [Salinibacterium sedimenticola]
MKATPTLEDITELADRRSDASVMISLPTSPVASEVERLRLEYKNAMKEADRQLEAADIDTDVRTAVRRRLDEVVEGEFWTHLAQGAVIFATPDFAREYRVQTPVPSRVAVGDRFDIGPLLRSLAFARTGYVLAVTEGSARLASISADVGPTEIPLDLPDDIHSVFERAENSGAADMHRAQGATGDKVELRKYCRIVQEAVIRAINGRQAPLVLAASNEMLSAYREVNSYPLLLEECVDVNPSSLSLQDLEDKARGALRKDYENSLAEWRETFGTRLNHGRASVNVADIARAASMGAVEELHFDVADDSEGIIDADGDITPAPVPGATSFGIFDEIAVRVLRLGGTVRAVQKRDLPGKQGIAAMLRFELET